MIQQHARIRALALPLAALTLAVSSAYAAPTVGSSGPDFYTHPATVPAGAAGDLLSYRPATVNLGASAPANKAFNVLYLSNDSVNKPNVVSGTVFVPTAAWTGTGPRPVILYAVGTHGLNISCAPSRQFEIGKDYEAANIAAALKAGYSVLVTDYAGYLNNSPTGVTYLAGASQGHAVLDIFKAAAAIPGVGIDASAPVGIWGYSQGGQSAGWAGELVSSGYAAGLNVKGVAAGGIPADFVTTAKMLEKNVGFAFLGSSIDGLQAQYPKKINIQLLANEQGKAALADLKTECVFEALFEYMGKSISEFTTDNQPLDALLDVPDVNDVLLAQNLGKTKINVPLYHYHGQADEFIPLGQDIALKRAYCAKGTDVTFELYPSEHIVTQFQAAPTVLSWMADRFAGKPTQNNCANTAPEPQPTNNPGGSELVVTLNKWKLGAKVHLKTLMQDVVMPAESTFTADANVSKNTLNGNISIPNFTAPINIVGIKFPTGLSIEPAAPTTGSVKLDNDGTLHVHGKTPVNIVITSLLGIPFGRCVTATPVEFPIDFDGPLSSFGNGNLTFKGTVAFPKIQGCFISGILSAFMSGSGQTFEFNVSPPAPVKY